VKEVFIIAVQIVILASFVALVGFYGVVFWHWRNDAKKYEVRDDCWPGTTVSSRPAK
jgi:hypothetical protein